MDVDILIAHMYPCLGKAGHAGLDATYVVTTLTCLPLCFIATSIVASTHLVVPLVVEGVLLEAPGCQKVYGFAHVDQERVAQIGVIRALGSEGVLDLVVRPRHVEPGTPADLDLCPIVIRYFVPWKGNANKIIDRRRGERRQRQESSTGPTAV